MVICVDFDGTLAVHKYPKIGDVVPLAIETCLELQKLGHKLILFTMRDHDELDEAVSWCKEKGLEFWGINENPDQHTWSESRKVYGNLYIDDAAYGCPLINLVNEKPIVDWSKILELVKNL